MALITKFKSYTVNGPTDAVELMLRRQGSAQPLVLATTTRQRAGLSPAYEVGTYRPVEQSFEVTPLNIEGDFDEEAFSELAYGMFLPSSDEVTLEADFGGTAYTMTARVVSFGWVRYMQWEGTFQFLDPFWHAATPTVATASPVTVTGNVPALPKLSITGGAAVTRQRVTITDRTGHGVSACLVAVEPSEALDEANYRIWANGLEIPFAYVDGRLYFRVDAPPPPERVFVDVYMGASITNTVYAGALDPAGTELDAGLASGSVTTSITNAAGNPLAPSMAWHPGVSYKHDSQRPYKYGLDGDEIVLVDGDVVQDAPGLAGDADSYIIVTGSEAERVRNLDLTIHAGYQPSEQQAARSSGGQQVQRIIIKEFYEGSAHTATYTLGISTFPEVRQLNLTTDDGTTVTETTLWLNDVEIGDFATTMSHYLGIPVTQGKPGWYYLWFDEGPPEIPLLSVSLAAKDVITTTSTKEVEGDDSQMIPIRGTEEAKYKGVSGTSYDHGEPPVIVFEAVWVDPVTLEPLDDNPETSDLLPSAIRGQARAVGLYWTRDREEPYVAWERVVTGTQIGGTTVSLTGITFETPGAVQIGIGLWPVAKRFSQADWGRLTIDSDPVIDLDTSKTPQAVASAAIDAMYIPTARIRNAANGDTISIADYLADGGLDIVVDEHDIRGLEGVGPTYGFIRMSRGAGIFQLAPGENELQITGDIDAEDVTVSWRERLAV